jgi:hypothetical protein
MQIDPVLEWQRLVAEYRQKSEGELLELARDFSDLTQPAQQALRSEMRSRGLGDPENPKSVTVLQPTPEEPPQAPLPLRNAPSDPVDDIAFGNPFGAVAPQPVPDTPDTGDEAEGPHDYTWKTELCECETSEQARELVDALRKAGIDSWVDSPGSSSRYRSSGLACPRVLVAADQLDQARVIAARPIPQEIVEEEKEEAAGFVEPKCPKCGSDDVVLEGVNPENTWRCEQCDAQWTETLQTTEEESPKA